MRSNKIFGSQSHTHVVGVFKDEPFAVLRQHVTEQGRGRLFVFRVVGIVDIAGAALSVRQNNTIVKIAISQLKAPECASEDHQIKNP